MLCSARLQHSYVGKGSHYSFNSLSHVSWWSDQTYSVGVISLLCTATARNKRTKWRSLSQMYLTLHRSAAATTCTHSHWKLDYIHSVSGHRQIESVSPTLHKVDVEYNWCELIRSSSMLYFIRVRKDWLVIRSRMDVFIIRPGKWIRQKLARNRA